MVWNIRDHTLWLNNNKIQLFLQENTRLQHTVTCPGHFRAIKLFPSPRGSPSVPAMRVTGCTPRRDELALTFRAQEAIPQCPVYNAASIPRHGLRNAFRNAPNPANSSPSPGSPDRPRALSERPSPRPAPATAPGRAARRQRRGGPGAGRDHRPRAGTGPSRMRSAAARLRSAETSASKHPASSSNRETSTFCNKTAISCNFRSVAMCLLHATRRQTRALRHPARMQQREIKSCEPTQLQSSAFHPWPCTAPAGRLPIQHRARDLPEILILSRPDAS